MEPTLIQVFGTNASQDATTLTITKANLTGVGLTPGANNTAESLLVAILKNAQLHLTAANQESNINQSIIIEDGFLPSFVVRNDSTYRRDSLTVNMDKSAGTLTIDPDDY